MPSNNNDIVLQIFDLIGISAPERLLLALKIISGIITIILGWAVLLLVIKSGYTTYLKTNLQFLKSDYQPLKAGSKVDKEWGKITQRVESKDEANLKLAIIEADKLVDDLLRGMNYPGDSMGDRLKQIDESRLKTINELWEVHKVRNNIVHNASFRLSQREAKNAMEVYEKVLKEFEALS